jgi:putative transposase
VPNRPCADPGTTFHVVNRATRGQLLFEDFGEYLSFLRLLAWALSRAPIDLFAYCLMPNHWHLLLRPATHRDLSAFMYELSKEHALGLRRWRRNEGCGAVYQGRYRASAVHTETYFYRAARYVERNPVRAKLAERVDEWSWSSASRIGAIQGVLLADWPLPRPANWSEFVNDAEPQRDVEFIRHRTRRCEPLADPTVDLDEEFAAIPPRRKVAIPDQE